MAPYPRGEGAARFGATSSVGQCHFFGSEAGNLATAKVNSLGCTPQLSNSGLPSFTTADPFQVTATQILNQRPSKLIWSRGANATPFQGGVLCVQSPAARTTVRSSGGAAPGTSDCSGSYNWVFTPA